MEKTSRSEDSVRYIPDEIWPEILSTLPVKYLLRFRSVSPSWRTLIDSPEFARLHLTRFPNHTHIFLAEQMKEDSEDTDEESEGTDEEPEEQRCVIRCSKTLELTATLDLPFDYPIAIKNWRVVSSIDGLLMLRIYESGQPYYMMWNPSIRRSRKIPSPPEFSDDLRRVEFGFGFDPLLKDHKYVQLGVKYPEGQVLSIQVFTVGINSWRNIGVEGCSCFVNKKDELRSFCRRGVLYTLASDKISGPVGLVSFDLRSEVFAYTRLPVEDHQGGSMFCYTQALTLMNGEDSLVFVDMSRPKCTVWVTENLGAEFQSLIWTQPYIFFPKISRDNVFCLITGGGSFLHLKRNGDILVNCNAMVTSHNLETGEKKILLENVSLYGKNNTWPFIESLVLY